VNGGRMLGSYPTALDERADVNIGRNHRMLPTTAWESVWYGIAEWFGADTERVIEEVLPNIANFPPASRMTAAQLMRTA